MTPARDDLPRPFFARQYARLSPGLEAAGMAGLRTELLAPLTGEVVEVGAGNGLNFAHYPPAVRRVVAVEPEPRLRALATTAAARAGTPVTVLAGRAELLPLPDDSVDGAVLCLTLCSVAGRRRALAELVRVLRPGGTLRFLEHTLASTPGRRHLQRLADATLWPLLAGGCRTATDPVADLEAAGLAVQQVRSFPFPATGPWLPATPHVLGSAVAS
ncbi:methyltransferase domain-containing protein [Auraticoccus sp. F435]|uniref:Methyltransferase domain-containing protein n=1 Tax=Auraticoccus cholistanensis TaxID=2656650 RepID=A0A6A9UUL0_9ACTN|nr:class I SAM-dependent methyltransferase [Auraticoccus cholistanensis]MVA75264.1 methyltransferase domain-containing protein [Auraticoccus cholistanensis]